MAPGTTHLSLNSLPFMILFPILFHLSFVLFSFFLCPSYHPQSSTAKIGVASVASEGSLETASTSLHVGGPWVDGRCFGMRAVPFFESSLGRRSSSFQGVSAPPNLGKGLEKVT